ECTFHLERDWVVVIENIYREGNKAADFLAGIGHGDSIGLHSSFVDDSNLGYFLR
ncbi:hypothetical protein LINPERHAP1_LOCUS20066, partial [Linum perenne]